MNRIVIGLAAACGATAAAQTPDAPAVLQAAAASMQSVRTVAYDARLELRGGTSWRVVTGQVQLQRFAAGDASDPVGGRLAVEGEITRSGAEAADAFRAAYDGLWVRRVQPRTRAVLRGQAGFGGEGLLRGSFGDLILREYLAPEPLAAELAASVRRVTGRAEVNGVPCDVVEVGPDDDGRRVEWSIGVDDHLPRRYRRWFRSARGTEVELTLTIGNLQVNTDIDPSAFEIETPDGYVVETVGKRPPRELKVGDPCPDWELAGSDGRTHKLSEYRGRLVVLDFWASWCPHCKRAMPAVQRMHDTYKDRGVSVLALNCRDRGEVDPVKFVRDRGFSYLVGDGNEVAIDYRVGGLPSFYVIDAEGQLLYRASGYNEQKERQLIDVIDRYLESR